MTTGAGAREHVAAAAAEVVGRSEVVAQVLATIAAGRSVLLEGPAGTGKSTVLRAVAAAAGVSCFTAEGSAMLTPARLIGSHDPSAVLARGHRQEDFVPGPLVDAMRSGGILHIEEFNRVPADTLNALLQPLADGRLDVSYLETVVAAPGFVMVASMNPFDHAGTTLLGRSVADRVVRIAVGHQSAEDEVAIVRRRAPDAPDELTDIAVRVIRGLRAHPEVMSGPSVRGAIDLCLVAPLLNLVAPVHGSIEPGDDACVLDAAIVSLSGRLILGPGSRSTPEQLIAEVVSDVLDLAPRVARGTGSLDVENAIRMPLERDERPKPARNSVLPPARPAQQAVWPRAGRAEVEPRVYRPHEVASLVSARAALAGQGRSRQWTVRPLDDEAAAPEGTVDPMLQEILPDGEGTVTGPRMDAADETRRVEALRLARQITAQMARRVPSERAGRGRLKTIRYRHGSDDLDLDRTLESVMGKPYPEPEDIWVMERVRARRAYALLLDISGSMKGRQLETAAMATAAVAAGLMEDELTVIAFWRDVAVLKRVDQPLKVERLLRDILSLRASGLTNLTSGLQTGLRELARSRADDRVAILLSDGGHNVGGDPLAAAHRYDVLHVIGTSGEEPRIWACRELAARGSGRAAFINSTSDIPLAVNACLTA